MFRGSHARVQDALALLVDGSVQPRPRDQRHLARCLTCRNQLAYFEAIRTAAGELQTRQLQPPVGLLSEVMRSLDENGVRSQRTKPFGVAAALGGTVLAACGLVIFGKNRNAMCAMTTRWRPS